VEAIEDWNVLRPLHATPGGDSPPSGDDMIGFSSGMREVQKKIGVAASGEVTVLIEGETGTGKDLSRRNRTANWYSLRTKRRC
jgi:transcriptional regulator with GAF, ATPase, and Fis domain